MLSKEVVFEIANKLALVKELFVVEVVISAGNDIEVVVDSVERVCLNQCAELSKEIQAQLDAICDDYSIVVASAGIGSNLRDNRQIAKTVGKEVSVVMKNGEKFVGTLSEFADGVITVEFQEKVAVEGAKKKQLVDVTKKIALDETKSIVEELKIK